MPIRPDWRGDWELAHQRRQVHPHGGRIDVTADREDGHAVIRVTDTGIGIPADMLSRVFDLFAQVESHRDRAQGGLGIGLALVKKLIELHGGEVTAESPGSDRGSTFAIRLPLAAGSPIHSTPESKSAGTRREKSRRVLVVDDNLDAAESLSELLALSGHQTATAQNGPDALATAARFRPELVFLDIGLPGMSGYEVACAHCEPICAVVKRFWWHSRIGVRKKTGGGPRRRVSISI